MDIRDYASMIDAIGTQEEKAKKPSAPKAKPTIEVEYADMVDFILVRKTKNTKRLLMVMPSKGKVCVSDGRTAEEVTDKTLSEFFAGNTDLDIAVVQTVYMAGTRGSTKEKVNKIRALIEKQCVGILKYGVLTEIPELSHYRNRWNWNGYDWELIQTYETEMQFALRMMQKENMKMYSNKFFRMMSAINCINKLCGVDNARYFIECMINSRIEIGDVGDKFQRIFNPIYKLNPRRTIEYLCYELPEQGILSLDGGYHGMLSDYADYLTMEYQMYDEVRDKYPHYLKTQHDISAMKYMLVQNEITERNFGKCAEQYRNLVYKDDKYTIAIPERPADLVEEGRRLCHCVASYAERVANGETMIVFCRRNSNVDDPYCTIEVRDGQILQARCLQNAKPSEETIDFIRKWAKAKSLQHNFREEVA